MGWPWRRERGPHVAPPAQRTPDWAQTAAPPSATVLLGFDDGSQVQLAETDPNALALLAVADLLVQDPAREAETSSEGSTTDRRTR
jgi:hypothetical protein